MSEKELKNEEQTLTVTFPLPVTKATEKKLLKMLTSILPPLQYNIDMRLLDGRHFNVGGRVDFDDEGINNIASDCIRAIIEMTPAERRGAFSLEEASKKFESFSWMPPIKRYPPNGTLYKVTALGPVSEHITTDGTTFERLFSQDELTRSARTLAGKPINIDHMWDRLRGTNIVLDAEEEDDLVECLCYTEDPWVNELYDKNELRGASVEYYPVRGEIPMNGYAQRGIQFDGIAFMWRFKPAFKGSKVERVPREEIATWDELRVRNHLIKIEKAKMENMNMSQKPIQDPTQFYAAVGLLKKIYEELQKFNQNFEALNAQKEKLKFVYHKYDAEHKWEIRVPIPIAEGQSFILPVHIRTDGSIRINEQAMNRLRIFLDELEKDNPCPNDDPKKKKKPEEEKFVEAIDEAMLIKLKVDPEYFVKVIMTELQFTEEQADAIQLLIDQKELSPAIIIEEQKSEEEKFIEALDKEMIEHLKADQVFFEEKMLGLEFTEEQVETIRILVEQHDPAKDVIITQDGPVFPLELVNNAIVADVTLEPNNTIIETNGDDDDDPDDDDDDDENGDDEEDNEHLRKAETQVSLKPVSDGLLDISAVSNAVTTQVLYGMTDKEHEGFLVWCSKREGLGVKEHPTPEQIKTWLTGRRNLSYS